MAGRSTEMLIVVLAVAALAVLPTARAAVAAVFVLGDSTADVGNNNFLPGSPFKVNIPFYGIDFPGGVATGRFSNGYNGMDFLAQHMGFKQSPPPYLSVNDTKMFLEGVNFASGGSGILDVTGQNKSLSLNQQLEYMKGTAEIISKLLGKTEAETFLSRSVFVLSTGSNDMFGFSAISAALNITKQQYPILLADTYQGQLQRLYEMGARKLVIVGTTPVGCIPNMRRLSPTGDCNQDLNDISRDFNAATMNRLRNLSKTFKDMEYSYLRAYRIMSDVISSPSQFGYDEFKSACCGGGVLNADSNCMPNATLCADRTDYVFWDRVHPTEVTYSLLAKQAYTGDRRFVRPVNVQQLISY